MKKVYKDGNIHIPLLAQEINGIFLSEGWESQLIQLSNPMVQQTETDYYDYEIRAMKKAHLHHAEQVVVRVRGYPNNFSIIIEEENIGILGKELINHKLFTTIEKEMDDGLFNMPKHLKKHNNHQQPVSQPIQQMMIQSQQGIKCPQCGFINTSGAKFCMNCGTKLF